MDLDEAKVLINDLRDILCDVEMDRDYYKAVVQGIWPNADGVIKSSREKMAKRMAAQSPAETLAKITTDPSASGLNAGKIGEVGPQNAVYLVLSEEERAKGFVRPLHHSYTHTKCGSVTYMAQAVCETYANHPKFYTATFCATCSAHLPVDQFIWPDGSQVGS